MIFRHFDTLLIRHLFRFVVVLVDLLLVSWWIVGRTANLLELAIVNEFTIVFGYKKMISWKKSIGVSIERMCDLPVFYLTDLLVCGSGSLSLANSGCACDSFDSAGEVWSTLRWYVLDWGLLLVSSIVFNINLVLNLNLLTCGCNINYKNTYIRFIPITGQYQCTKFLIYLWNLDKRSKNTL